MTTAQEYAAALLTEEMGEALLELGKAGRFGLDTPGPVNTTYMGQTARARLEKELGDVIAAIDYAIKVGLVDQDRVDGYADAKLEKLLDPKSRDAQGNRLAPETPPSPDPLGRAGYEAFVDAFYTPDPVRPLAQSTEPSEWSWYRMAREHFEQQSAGPPQEPAPDIVGFHSSADGSWKAFSAKEPEPEPEPEPELKDVPPRIAAAFWLDDIANIFDGSEYLPSGEVAISTGVFDPMKAPPMPDLIEHYTAPSPAGRTRIHFRIKEQKDEPPTLDQLRAEIGVMYTYIANARDEITGAERYFDRIATMLRGME